MFSLNNINVLMKWFGNLALAILFSCGLTVQASLPVSVEGGVPKLAGLQIGMTAQQAKKSLVGNGYTPMPSRPGLILIYDQGQERIRFQLGKHNPIAFATYTRRVKLKAKDRATLGKINQGFVNQFKSAFGQQAKCQSQNYAVAFCDYTVKKGGKIMHQVKMHLIMPNLNLTLSGDPTLAGASVAATTSNTPVQKSPAKHSKFTVKLKNNVVYINNLRLNDPASKVKDEITKLGYRLSSEYSGQIVFYNNRDSVRAKLRRGVVRSISISEYDVQGNGQDNIEKLKASFGGNIECKGNSLLTGCNYRRREPGKFTSLTVSFKGNKRNKQTHIKSILLRN